MPKKKTSKTIEEINRRIKQGKVVVVTADEMTDIVKRKGAEKAARRLVALHREAWQGRDIGPEHLTKRFETHIANAARRMTEGGLGAVSEFWRDGEVAISLRIPWGVLSCWPAQQRRVATIGCEGPAL